MKLSEIKTICQKLIDEDNIDFLDLSLWDCFKFPEEYPKSKQTLLGHITDLNFKTIKLTVAGNIRTGKDVQEVLYSGVDFVTIGRSGILHHDFPKQVLSNPNFKPILNPVTPSYLKSQGLSDKFIDYMRRWDGFVSD